jgi:hypothetical protein
MKTCNVRVILSNEQVERIEREPEGDNEIDPVCYCELWGRHGRHIAYVQAWGRKAVWVRWSTTANPRLVWGNICPVGQDGDDDEPFCILWDGHIGRHYLVKGDD